ncbi:uncharacterized protein ARMOST_19236 [Armillaria ostoyae]|uniref:Uncharacterized protein n=1 Tax=Armillaria ostoyae TaxID=47428 RepID=A0A284S3Z5_ARMOS|nr:uncharacterized protein ARMOST_19236 [Armillaria ostoyae]
MDSTGSNQTSYHGIVLPLEYQRQFAMYDSWNTHRFPYDGILQQPLWDTQPRPYEYFGHDNNHSQGPWALEQSYPRVDGSFPAGVGLDSLAASSRFHQHWDGTSAPSQTVPKDLGQAVVSLEMVALTPSAGAVDPIQHGSNIGKIVIPVYPRPDGYIKKHFDNKTTQKIAEIWDISPECVFYLFPVINVKCICPIATCTSGLAMFQGHTIKDHLAHYHPNISKEESISCVRESMRKTSQKNGSGQALCAAFPRNAS